MRARADPKGDIGLANPQFLEKHVGQILVVVLAGVNQGGCNPSRLVELSQNGGDFHEVGAGTSHDGYSFHKHLCRLSEYEPS